MRVCSLTSEHLERFAKASHVVFAADTQQGVNFGEHFAAALEELVDRRAAEESELRQLERQLAYDSASSILDCALLHVYRDGEPDLAWHDLGDNELGDEPDIDDAVKYLELRGLIQCDENNPKHIAIREESEATA